MQRRHFFYGIFSLSTACSTARIPSSQAKVSIAKAASYDIELCDLICRIVKEHQLAVAGKLIVLKPNLVEFNPNAPINTNPLFVAAVLEAFRSMGAASVTIAEGPGHRRATLDMAESAGFFSCHEGI